MVGRRALLASAGLGTVGIVLGLSRAQGQPGPATLRLSDAEWKKRLTPAQYAVLREADTERPFSSPLNNEHRKGIFACAGCDLPLYSSDTKFDSHTGWPSFWKPLPRAVTTKIDRTMGMVRTEVRCARCDGHLGHVFHDGPPPTGLRYCMNGLALKFHQKA